MLDKFQEKVEQKRIHYEMVYALARAYMVNTVVGWFTKLKSQILKPFRVFRRTIEDKIVDYVAARQARKQAHTGYMYSVLLRAAEDCVILNKDLLRDVIRFDSTREVTPALKFALLQYMAEYKDPSQYGKMSPKKYVPGPGDIASYVFPIATLEKPSASIPRSKERHAKTVHNTQEQRSRKKNYYSG